MSNNKAVNVGTIGHIDHGRTTLTAALMKSISYGLVEGPFVISSSEMSDPIILDFAEELVTISESNLFLLENPVNSIPPLISEHKRKHRSKQKRKRW